MIRKYWNKWRREIDIIILWPAITKQARDLNMARDAFLLHIQFDNAWSDLTKDEILDIIQNLK